MTADIIRLPAVPVSRSPVEINAEMRRIVGRLKELALELAVAHGADTSAIQHAEPDQVLSLQRAADAIGWSERRLRRHIVKHNRISPKDPLGFQPGGMAKTAWCIPLARLRRYVRDHRD